MKIPTQTLNLQEDNVPERLLQLYLNNYKIPSRKESDTTPDKITNVVETNIEEEGEAEAIQLSNAFSSSDNASYQYHLGDLKDIIKRPPTYVKITRVPQHG